MSFQLPITQCRRCQCDASVTINITGGGGAMYAGTEDPNVSGFIPVDPQSIATFDLLTPDGYYFGTQWKWNVANQFWG